MTTAAVPVQDAVAGDVDGRCPARTLFVNIKPIMDSVAGRLTDAEIDAWFEGFERANEGRGFYLELTREGELAINPMVNSNSGKAELMLGSALQVWEFEHGGEAQGSRTIIRLPDGSRVEADASWLSPEQVAQLPPVGIRGAITVCPAFVAEIRSDSDNLSPLRRKMERYVANGARLGWLIDPYRRQVYVYRRDSEPEILQDPETISGESTLPGFVFEVRRLIFDIQRSP